MCIVPIFLILPVGVDIFQFIVGGPVVAPRQQGSLQGSDIRVELRGYLFRQVKNLCSLYVLLGTMGFPSLSNLSYLASIFQ